MMHRMVVVGLGLLVSLGCGETDQVVDCSNICESFEGCAPDLSPDECFDSCEDFSDAKTDRCDACVDDNGCDDCATECEGLDLD